ncbi:MAG TPA: pantoate--beta-alanine ligase [Actinomycetota bacterium]|nr:pantoate--beta-alanine ligase [Actinomycetota bacterium]
MRVVRRSDELGSLLEERRRKGLTVGLVPTMGALHAGHLSLVRRARHLSDVVVVSVFVNPKQFGEGEDFEHYPRDTEGDLELLRGERTDIAFLPSVENMYPPGATVEVTAGPIGDVYEGADRPGHFNGVCTVVAKLFNIVEPDLAVFGQKDAQQAAVVKRLVKDLDFAIDLIVAPIVREGDGLALSSRNVYLTAEQRNQALALSRSLELGRDAYTQSGDFQLTEKTMLQYLQDAEGVDVSYAGVVDPDSFDAPQPSGRILLIVAGRVGKTRLIDNLVVEAADGGGG